jgi:hypothetical protein
MEKDTFHQQIGIKFKEDINKVLHFEHTFVWCWNLDNSESRPEIPEMFWNEEVLHKVLHTIKRRKVNWIGHIFCKGCFLKHIIAWKIEVRVEMTWRQGRRRKQQLTKW